MTPEVTVHFLKGQHMHIRFDAEQHVITYEAKNVHLRTGEPVFEAYGRLVHHGSFGTRSSVFSTPEHIDMLYDTERGFRQALLVAATQLLIAQVDQRPLPRGYCLTSKIT
jgi:hypothetical protein